MTARPENDARSLILTDENHPFGCEYLPDVVTIRRHVGGLLLMFDVMGERCKWCKEGFISAKTLGEIEDEEEKIRQALLQTSKHSLSNSSTSIMPMTHPALHLHYLLVRGTADLSMSHFGASSDSITDIDTMQEHGNSSVPVYSTATPIVPIL